MEKIIKLIESFKGKFETPSDTDDIDFSQFVLPTDDICLVVIPYNMFNIWRQQGINETITEYKRKLNKELEVLKEKLKVKENKK